MVEAIALTPFATQAYTFVTGLIPSVVANAAYDGLRYTSGQLANKLTSSPVEQLPENDELERAAYRAYLRTCQILLGLEGYVHPVQRAANPHSNGQIHVLAALEIALKHVDGDDWRAHLPNKQQFANAQQLVTNALSRHEAVQEAGIAEAREPTPDAPSFSELEQWLITYAIKDLNNLALDAGQTLPTESLLKRFNDPNKGFLPVYKHFIGEEIKQGDEAFFRIFIATELANASSGVVNTAHTINALLDTVVAEISAVTTLVKAEFQALSQQMAEQTNKIEEVSELQLEIKNALFSYLQAQQSATLSTGDNLAPGAQLNGKLAAPNLQPQLKIPPTQDSITHFTQRAFEVIGREKEQQILREFLHAPADANNNASGNLKWIQIAGQGGQGKSRLALELVMEALEIESSDSQYSNHKRSPHKQSGKWKAGMLERSALTEFLTFAGTWQPDFPHLMVFDYLVGNEAPIAALFKTLTERRQQFRYPVRVVLVERQAWNKGGLTRKADPKTTNASPTESVANQDFALQISPGQGNAEWYDKLAAEGFTYLSETRFGSGVVELGRLTQQQLAFLCQQMATKQNPAATLSSAQIEQQLAKIDISGRPLYAYFLGQALAQKPEGRYNTKEQLLDEILQHEYRRRWVPTVQSLKDEHTLPEGIELSGQSIDFSEQSFTLRFAILACIVRVIDIKQVAQQANWPKPHPDEIYLAQVINDNPVNAANLTSPRYIAGLQPDLLGEYFALLQLDDMWSPEPLWQLCWQISPNETAAFLLRTTQDFPTHEITQRLLNIAPPNREGETALEGVAADITLALHDAKLGFPNTIVQALQRAAGKKESKHGSQAMNILAWCYYSGKGLPQSNEQAVKYWQQAAESGNVNAMFNLAFNYAKGDSVEQDLLTANQLYQQAADLGHSNAMLNLGVSYENGRGIEQDTKKANDLYLQATELGNDYAMFNLAVNYANGNGIELDQQKANQLYQQAAELGNANAIFNLAINYQSSNKIAQNSKKVNLLYQQAAKLGHVKAMFNLAVNYQNGNGVEQNIEKANQLYQQAAELGNAPALNNLAINYKNGKGVEQDLPKANQLWQQAAELGDTNAMVNLGFNYTNGNGGEQDIQKANQLWQQAAESGDANAMFNLAFNYAEDDSVEPGLLKANQLYQQAADLGHANAMLNLGVNYENGKGIEQDIQKANHLYHQATKLGNDYAMFNLALNYASGNGIEQDSTKAKQLYQQAAELGNPNAIYNLAISYQNSNFFGQNSQKINLLYQQAAELGHAKAMFNLAINYQNGNGVEQDLQKANQFFQQAAELGHPKAMVFLGLNYEDGNGVEQDLSKANQLYQQAAELGDTDAMVFLGLNYEDGNSVEQDLSKANQLYQQAAELGDEQAMVNLACNYENGDGVEQDLPKANQLYQQAVELGVVQAMVFLGNNYANGKGVEQDHQKANQLYQQAADLGDAKAKRILRLFKK